MRRTLSCLALLLALPLAAAASGESDSDDIVRLPGQQAARGDYPGPIAPDSPGMPKKGEKLVPGGILFVSFDADGDGVVSPDELQAGIAAAFAAADTNGDGQLTALEQQAWAASLPARDDSLANPVRFDPNLDRIVTFEEFSSVIRQLAASYQNGEDEVVLSGLIVPDKTEKDDKRFAQRGGPRSETGPGGPQR